MLLPCPVRAVIFDLDGVLLDTEPLYSQATSRIAARFGKTYGWNVKQLCMGRSDRVSAEILCRELGLPLTPEQYLMERAAHLQELFRGARPLPGAPELVSSLLERNIPLAIATSSTRENLSWKLPQHAFLAPIRVVVPGDDPDLRAAKPAPDIFLLAASRLGVRPEDAVVFEDSPAGVKAARAAGMQVVARVEPELDPEHFRGATLQVRSLTEISAADLGFG